MHPNRRNSTHHFDVDVLMQKARTKIQNEKKVGVSNKNYLDKYEQLIDWVCETKTAVDADANDDNFVDGLVVAVAVAAEASTAVADDDDDADQVGGSSPTD